MTEADVTETEVAAPAPRASAEVPALTAPIEATQAEPTQPEVPPRTTNRMGAEQRWLLALILVALVAGIIGLFVNRSTDSPFNELSPDWHVDITVWVLTLAIGVPLLLRNGPVAQRFVLIGVTASSLFFGFLQASAVVRYGPDWYDEGPWFLVKLLQTACLFAACFVVRRRRAEPIPSSPAVRIGLVALAAMCAALMLSALYDQWSQTEKLVEEGYVPDRTPFVVWFMALALGPIVMTIALAASRSYGARLSLATLATLAVVSCTSQALVIDQVFDRSGTGWAVAAAAYCRWLPRPGGRRSQVSTAPARNAERFSRTSAGRHRRARPDRSARSPRGQRRGRCPPPGRLRPRTQIGTPPSACLRAPRRVRRPRR